MKIFVICGYGIPPDIEQDENYHAYLHPVLNYVYESAQNQPAIIITSGGPTATHPSIYKTEASMIAAYLKKRLRRSPLSKTCRSWKLLAENRSLSTLENIVFCFQMIQKRHFQGTVTFFCEKTRAKRVRVLAQKIFSDTHKLVIIPIDFDVSLNRYLDPKRILEKEQKDLDFSLWALKAKDGLAKHHALFKKKLVFLKKCEAQGMSHVEAVGEWYKQAPLLMKEMR